MEEELDKTKLSYQTQISAHEKKAHNNWVSNPRMKDGPEDLIDFSQYNLIFYNVIHPRCMLHVTNHGLIFQLAARAADRELADIRRENALLRQK